MLELKDVKRDKDISSERFKNEYLKTRQPVIIKDLMKDWPAKKKWTIDYLKENYGDLEVPLFSKKSSTAGKKYMKPDIHMRFAEYLDLIDSGPTEYRMFLFNIFRHIPEMRNDYKIPTIMSGFINSFPYMFFGGAGSVTPLHYDIDLSHVFLNQIHGRKRVVLFSPEQSHYLYHHPYTVASYVDLNNPDYEEYPAMKYLNGYDCTLNPGETLFIPSGYWHYIEYVDGGYSISLRANESYIRRARGLYRIARHYVVDRGLNQLLGARWTEIKENMARKNAERELA